MRGERVSVKKDCEDVYTYFLRERERERERGPLLPWQNTAHAARAYVVYANHAFLVSFLLGERD